MDPRYTWGKSKDLGLITQASKNKGRKGSGAAGPLSSFRPTPALKDVPSYRTQNPWTATPRGQAKGVGPSGNIGAAIQASFAPTPGGFTTKSAYKAPKAVTRSGSFPTSTRESEKIFQTTIPTEDSTEDTTEDTTEDSTEDTTEDSTEDTTEDSTEDTTEDSDSGTVHDPNSVWSPDAPAEMNLAELTDDMMLSTRIKQMLNTNNPMFKAASTRALQAMARRGIVNSSMAQESVMNAIMNVVMPIAKADVDALQKEMYANQDWTNKQKSDLNAYYYKNLQQKLDGIIKQQLQTLIGKQQFAQSKMEQAQANWRRYGDWMSAIATAEGAEADDWERMRELYGDWPGRV